MVSNGCLVSKSALHFVFPKIALAWSGTKAYLQVPYMVTRCVNCVINEQKPFSFFVAPSAELARSRDSVTRLSMTLDLDADALWLASISQIIHMIKAYRGRSVARAQRKQRRVQHMIKA